MADQSCTKPSLLTKPREDAGLYRIHSKAAAIGLHFEATCCASFWTQADRFTAGSSAAAGSKSCKLHTGLWFTPAAGMAQTFHLKELQQCLHFRVPGATCSADFETELEATLRADSSAAAGSMCCVPLACELFHACSGMAQAVHLWGLPSSLCQGSRSISSTAMWQQQQ